MQNPFSRRAASLSGPATDVIPVTPSNTADLPRFALSLYVEAGGSLRVITIEGAERTLSVADFSFLPVGVRRVYSTGTTAQGIHALSI